jgi:hypothetical protein
VTHVQHRQHRFARQHAVYISICLLLDPLTCIDHAGRRAVAAVGVKCRVVPRFWHCSC